LSSFDDGGLRHVLRWERFHHEKRFQGPTERGRMISVELKKFRRAAARMPQPLESRVSTRPAWFSGRILVQRFHNPQAGLGPQITLPGKSRASSWYDLQNCARALKHRLAGTSLPLFYEADRRPKKRSAVSPRPDPFGVNLSSDPQRNSKASALTTLGQATVFRRMR